MNQAALMTDIWGQKGVKPQSQRAGMISGQQGSIRKKTPRVLLTLMESLPQGNRAVACIENETSSKKTG